MEVRQNLQFALTLLIDAETGTRGYLLTDRQEWLKPYENALRRFPSVVVDIEKLVSDNPVQVARLRHMEQIAGDAVATSGGAAGSSAAGKVSPNCRARWRSAAAAWTRCANSLPKCKHDEEEPSGSAHRARAARARAGCTR